MSWDGILKKKIKICIFLSISGFVLIWRFQNRQFRPILVVFLVPFWHQNDHQYCSKLEDSLGGCWGCMWKSNFLNQKVLAISKVKNSPFTFSIPAPEASPVLTLGISSKGQVRTNYTYANVLTRLGTPLPLVVGKLALVSFVKYFPTMKLVSSLGFPRMRAAR